VFAYCNALNALLSGPQSHRHRVTIGDVATIFWTDKKTSTESLFAKVLGGDISQESETTVTEDQTQHRQIQALLNILRKGGGASLAELKDDPNTKFYILGLSGNVTRLVVRFWHVSTIGQILENLHDHYLNLAITCKKDRHPFWEPEFPSAERILDQTARERKAIAPLLGGQLMQAILHRTPYPITLLQAVHNRLRANEPVDYLKAAIFKAFLNRNHLTKPIDNKMTEAIDPTRKEPAYHLGRLFAVYETAQKSAQPGINRTIRETMYSAASATPLAVFGRLERLHHHHTAKKSHPYCSSKSYSDIVAEIEQNFKGNPAAPYPRSLNLIDQSFFAVGYYHQLQHFKQIAETKRNEKTSHTSENNQPTKQ
jgi:CRISPR-associated protein Csd1